MIVYKVYPYSIWATLCSIVSALIAAFLIILGIKFFTYNEAELPLAIVSVVAELSLIKSQLGMSSANCKRSLSSALPM